MTAAAAAPPHLPTVVPSSPPPKAKKEEEESRRDDENDAQSSLLPNINASTTRNNATTTTISAKARFQQRLLRRTLLPLSFNLPYILGLLWTASHPLISIITGELKCRGSYIDEHGLDVHRHRVAVHPTERHRSSSSSSSNSSSSQDERRVDSMCDSIRHFSSISSSSSSSSPSTTSIHISPSIECYHHDATPQISFDIVRILPSIGPSIDVVESIVLVVGGSSSTSSSSSNMGRDNDDSNGNDWYNQNDMNASLLHLISKLGNRKDTPWLSKVVLIVSPIVHSASTLTGQQHEGNDCRRRRRGDSGDSCASLTLAVDAFIASYFLDHGTSTVGGVVRPLPPDFTFPMIRSLLVIHDDDNHQQHEDPASSSMTEMDRSRTEVQILPHGIGGSLPNLDLVFATLFSFQSHPAGGRAMDRSSSIYYGNSKFAIHPLLDDSHVMTMQNIEKRMITLLNWIANILGIKNGPMIVEQYVDDWMGLVRFVLGMAIGPRQPHSSALQHGIDSLTIRVHIPKKKGEDISSPSSSSPSLSIHPHYADLTRCLEHLLRSISNLHERLHHSVSQYLLPSPTKFVSHGEYIYPGVLISSPMVIRAATLALRDVKRFQVMFVGNVLACVGLASLVIGMCVMNIEQSLLWVNVDNGWMMNAVYSLSYAIVFFAVMMARDRRSKCYTGRKVTDADNENEECRKSLRFVMCLLGVYLHAPLLLANYSLGLPSVIFWSPLLGMFVPSPWVSAFLSRNRMLWQLLKIGGGIFLVATSPPILLVPRIFPFYTTYVLGVYTPLHLLLMVLVMI